MPDHHIKKRPLNTLLASGWFILACILVLTVVCGAVAGNINRTIAQLEEDKKIFDSQNIRSGVVSIIDVQRLLLVLQEALTTGEMTPELEAELISANDMLFVRADSFYSSWRSDNASPSPEAVAGSMMRIVETVDAIADSGFVDLDAAWADLLSLADESRIDLVEHIDRVQRFKNDLLAAQLEAVTTKRNVVWATLAGLMLFGVSALLLLRAEILSTKARQEAEARIRHLAFHDSLTGLPNRPSFQESLGLWLEHKQQVTLVLLDIDEFKLINDTYGHRAGDGVLIHFADILKGIATDHGALVARLGGDEFALLIPQTDLRDLAKICDFILAEFQAGMVFEGEGIAPSTSIGLVTSTQIASSMELDGVELFRAADFALYDAKSAGRCRYAIYDEALEAKFLARRKMVEDLPGAIARGEMEIYLQPKVRLATLEIFGFEALVRWRRDGDLVPPNEFIATAEECGQIIDLDRSVLRQSCRIIADFNRHHGTDFSISVNFSALQFNTNRCCEVVQGVLAETGLPSHLLTIEITETVEFGDLDQARPIIESLQSYGVQIAIDDFGAGFSSLSYLRNTFADEVKFDRSLVMDIHLSSSSHLLLESMIEIAHQLGLEVTIEGIETDDQLQSVMGMGPKNGQGFLWSKPKPALEALQMAVEQTVQAFDSTTDGRDIA